MYTGISSTFGNSVARWYRPDLNGLGNGCAERVPSGKMISEKPCSSASRSGCSGSASGSSRAAVDHHHVQFVPGDRPADARPVPVVLRRHRARVGAQRRRQRGPQHHGVHVAGVIGEVDALRRGRRGSDPPRVGADQQAHQPDDGKQELQDGLPVGPSRRAGSLLWMQLCRVGPCALPRDGAGRASVPDRRFASARPGALAFAHGNDEDKTCAMMTRGWLPLLCDRRRVAGRLRDGRRPRPTT